MERNRGPPFKKRPNPRFNKDGNKRGKFGEESSEGSPISETVFRILCQSRRIGSVIGKAGGVIKALREETQAKITVAESVPGSEERVIIIYSPSSQAPINNSEEDMELLCAAQDALIKVHDKIVEEDIFDDDDGDVVFARMLVPNNTVGCLLGRKGDVIRGLRNETGAVIRLLPADQLPICAMSTDEILQISGKPSSTRKALAKVSTLLHLNPRKDEPPSNMRPIGGHGAYRPEPTHAYGAPPPPVRPELSHAYGAPPVPWRGYATEPPRFVSATDGDHGDEPIEFPMKILCSEAKLGPIIGKNGISLRQFQQETGTSIHVDDPRVGSDERAILVSSFDALRNPRSRTIDAILLLQDKTSEHDEKGLITTRLLIPSSKVGCILGQGGTIINEMRRRIRADIRVYAKDEKPICAGEDEELVQVSGSYGVAKEALAEIGSRFRARFLRDARPKEGAAPPPSSVIRGAHEPYKAVTGRDYSYPAPPREYEPHPYIAPPVEYTHHAYQVPPPAPGYPGVVDMNSGQVPGTAPVVHNPSEVTGARPVALQDPYAAAPPGVDVYHGYGVPGGQATHPVQITYHETYGTQQGHYSDINSSAHTYHTTTTTTAATATTGTIPAYPPPTQQGQYVQTAHQYGQ